MRDIGVRLLNKKGKSFATYGDFYLKPVGFSEIPPFLIDALIATEDRRFLKHWGIDPISLIRAMTVNLKEGRIKPIKPPRLKRNLIKWLSITRVGILY